MAVVPDGGIGIDDAVVADGDIAGEQAMCCDDGAVADGDAAGGLEEGFGVDEGGEMEVFGELL